MGRRTPRSTTPRRVLAPGTVTRTISLGDGTRPATPQEFVRAFEEAMTFIPQETAFCERCRERGRREKLGTIWNYAGVRRYPEPRIGDQPGIEQVKAVKPLRIFRRPGDAGLSLEQYDGRDYVRVRCARCRRNEKIPRERLDQLAVDERARIYV